MKITARVKPNARKNEIVKLEDGSYLIKVTAPPVEGKANALVVEMLAEYFQKRKSDITVLRGEKGRDKIIEIL